MRVLLAIMLFISGTAFGQGFNDPLVNASPFDNSSNANEFLPVEEAYRLSVEVQGDRGLRLYWQIEEAYYLYKHRFAFELSNEKGPIKVETEFPPALERTDEYFGEVSVYYHEADITLTTEQATGTTRLKVTSQGCADAGLCYPPYKEYFEVDFSSGQVSPVEGPRRNERSTPPATERSAGNLLYMLLLAFIGGSILNLMPCVFPVLSLKMLSFARTGGKAQHAHGWVYSFGVVASFVLVAALLISLQRAGEAIGWGFHLQSPGFVIAMAYLFLAMGLSLSGLVELGSSIMGTGSELAEREGLSGSFFTGVLAVVVASPCTAPFMGTALGFAVTQPPLIALGIFAALGAGMAAPMLLLSYSSGLRGLMPKPGPWMETLKQFLAFPLYATAIWLLWVAGRQTGVDTMAAALTGALLISLAMWLWRYSGWRKLVAVACIIAAAGIISWSAPQDQAKNQRPSGELAWSEQKLSELRAAGRPVFVDVTADWCISCIANEQAVLLTSEIQGAFKDRGVTYLVADWTNYDADIAAFLKRHGRNGIPFYILYPADPGKSPQVLPQLLTKSLVLDALGELDQKNPKITASFQ